MRRRRRRRRSISSISSSLLSCHFSPSKSQPLIHLVSRNLLSTRSHLCLLLILPLLSSHDISYRLGFVYKFIKSWTRCSFASTHTHTHNLNRAVLQSSNHLLCLFVFISIKACSFVIYYLFTLLNNHNSSGSSNNNNNKKFLFLPCVCVCVCVSARGCVSFKPSSLISQTDVLSAN